MWRLKCNYMFATRLLRVIKREEVRDKSKLMPISSNE